MLRIRLQRVGRKHEPAFRVVLTESQNSTKTGRVQEVLGNYDPRFDKPVIKADRVKYWISVGAKPTDTMHNLLVSQKIIEGKKINVLPRKTPIKKDEIVKEEKATTEVKDEEVAETAEVKTEEAIEETAETTTI
ncbi:MAG: 30S ribosomal protein S16 [bacterium]|nr:30S ribosomal protein S16 [bacterium]